MRLVNLTPHAVVIETATGTVTAPPSGTVARCAEVRTPVGTVTVYGHEVPLVAQGFGKVSDLPAPETGTIYVVAALVAQAATERTDLAFPTDFVRDDQGRIIAARALARPA